MWKLDPIVSLCDTSIDGAVIPAASLVFTVLTMPYPVVGALSVPLGWTKASGSVGVGTGSSCGCLG